MFNRFWLIGWVSSRQYYKPVWRFHFNYYKKMFWQLMIFGFYITSVNKNSVNKIK